MTNADRKEARYQRRRTARIAKKLAYSQGFDNFNQMTNLDNLYMAFQKAKKNVSWKNSVQKYSINVFRKINETQRLLLEGKDVRKGFVEFYISERGKVRQIRSVHIEERVVQKCLCDFVMTPLLSRSLIYDNGASLKGKGMSFSENRLKKHLHEFYAENGSNEGYVLTIDFSKYFDNISHELLIKMLNDKISDSRLRDLIYLFVVAFNEKAEGLGKSLGLGSQISQLCAIYYPNRIDHYAKENLKIQGYGRYMDDIYLIHRDKKYLKHCLVEIQKLCADLRIVLNLRKTRICKLSDGVAFLKGRYILLQTGRVLITPLNNKATVRMKRRLRKLGKKVDRGETHYWDIFLMYYSWRQNFLKRFSAYRRIQSVDNVFWEALSKHHASVDPPVLASDNRPSYPIYKLKITDEDREDALISYIKNNVYYYHKNEVIYKYAGGFI
jgi:hypothetical protein